MNKNMDIIIRTLVIGYPKFINRCQSGLVPTCFNVLIPVDPPTTEHHLNQQWQHAAKGLNCLGVVGCSIHLQKITLSNMSSSQKEKELVSSGKVLRVQRQSLMCRTPCAKWQAWLSVNTRPRPTGRNNHKWLAPNKLVEPQEKTSMGNNVLPKRFSWSNACNISVVLWLTMIHLFNVNTQSTGYYVQCTYYVLHTIHTYTVMYTMCATTCKLWLASHASNAIQRQEVHARNTSHRREENPNGHAQNLIDAKRGKTGGWAAMVAEW